MEDYDLAIHDGPLVLEASSSFERKTARKKLGEESSWVKRKSFNFAFLLEIL